MRWLCALLLTLSRCDGAIADSHRAQDWPSGSAMHTGRLAEEKYADADKRLNVVYRQALDKVNVVPDGSDLRKRLIEAQRAWVAFRDKHCAVEGAYMGGASTWQGAHQISCLARITGTRTQELEEIVNR
jgi:uncharacterized protein YecT (DUF1311 family)